MQTILLSSEEVAQQAIKLYEAGIREITIMQTILLSSEEVAQQAIKLYEAGDRKSVV